MSKLFTVTSVGTAVGLQVVLIRELLTTMRCDSRVAVELWRSIKYFWRSKQTRAQSRDFTLTPRSAHFRAHAQSTRLADSAPLNYLAAAARLAQPAERKALNLVVVGSSPTVGVSGPAPHADEVEAPWSAAGGGACAVKCNWRAQWGARFRVRLKREKPTR